jgi:hypothetical protein
LQSKKQTMETTTSNNNAKRVSHFSLMAVIVIVEVIGLASSSSLPRRIDTRTTWPAETGTMVRILKRSPGVQFQDALDGLLADAPTAQDFTNFQTAFKRDLFLRTSKRSNKEAATRTPFLFRTSKRSHGAAQRMLMQEIARNAEENNNGDEMLSITPREVEIIIKKLMSIY